MTLTWGRGSATPRVFVSRHEPVLGTVAELRLAGGSRRLARAVDTLVLGAMTRLEAQFSVYRPTSELSRWRLGQVARPSPELRQLLVLSLEWQDRSAGIVNPGVGSLSERWKRAEASQTLPSADELAELAAGVASPRFAVNADGSVAQLGDCSELSFHALAKGMIVDFAVNAAIGRFGLGRRHGSFVLNVGGDLMHWGTGETTVNVENPLRAYDNEPPIATVQIGRQGMATSGGSRRGFRVGDQWFSHVIDPRTGWPVSSVAGATAVAEDAATADALATVLSVLAPEDGLLFAGARAAFVVDQSGRRYRNEAWEGLERPRASARPSTQEL